MQDDEMDFEDAMGVVGILFQTGRAVPPFKWIEALVRREANSENEGYF